MGVRSLIIEYEGGLAVGISYKDGKFFVFRRYLDKATMKEISTEEVSNLLNPNYTMAVLKKEKVTIEDLLNAQEEESNS